MIEQVKSDEDIILGYDAKDEKFTDVFAAGIIDAVKVTCVALQNAASIVGLWRWRLLLFWN